MQKPTKELKESLIYEWDDVKNISNKTCNAEYKYGDITEPDYEEIKEKKWDIYIIKPELFMTP